MEAHHLNELTRKPHVEAKVHEGIPSGMAVIHPLGYDLNSCAMRFLAAAVFGIKLDVLILFVFDAVVLAGFEPGTMGLLYTLIEVPVICGVLGVFFYTEMLDLTEDFLQTAQSALRRVRFSR